MCMEEQINISVHNMYMEVVSAYKLSNYHIIMPSIYISTLIHERQY